MRKILVIFFTLLISIFTFSMNGYVVKVSDGDSFVMSSYGKRVRVRMYGIDAPELKQSYGAESKKYLESLILHKKVKLKVLYEDKYKRKVAKVYCNGKQINLEMLETGNAWFYKYHARNEKAYRKAYEKAKQEKLGLWKQSNPQNPREFRLKNPRNN